MGEKLFLDRSLKNQYWAYLLINILKLVFIVCQIKDYRDMLKLSCRPVAFTSYKAYLKPKHGPELVSLAHFLHDFSRKIFILLYSITWPNFNVCLPLLREILGIMCIVIVR